MKKLICLCDSPTVNTGFAVVARNLLKRWKPHFDSIDIWGINHSGYPHDLPYRIYPGGTADWTTPQKFSQLLNLINSSDYTHMFILCDTNNIALHDFPKHIKMVADRKKVRTVYYFPVDSPLRKEWVSAIRCFDALATYTQYGHDELMRVAPPGTSAEIIPHGVDPQSFYPITGDLGELRKSIFRGWLKPDDILLLNVNRHERRKAPHHSLDIVRRLAAVEELPVKLFLHMQKENASEQTNLETTADWMGVPRKCWSHNDSMFTPGGNPTITEAGLNELYNVSDYVISTSLGEGWGLSISEGLAAGAQVVIPNHTSCKEIAETVQRFGQDNIHLLPLLDQPVVNPNDLSRVRYPVNTRLAAEIIGGLIEAKRHCVSTPMLDKTKEWLSWDRIANLFLPLFKV